MKRYFSLMIFVCLNAFSFGVQAWGVTHTVCSSGCDYTLLSSALSANAYGPGDIVSITGNITEPTGLWMGGDNSGVTIQGVGNPEIDMNGQMFSFYIQGQNGTTFKGFRLVNGIIGFYCNGETTDITIEDVTGTVTDSLFMFDAGAAGIWNLNRNTALNCGASALTINNTSATFLMEDFTVTGATAGAGQIYVGSGFLGALTVDGYSIIDPPGNGLMFEGSSGAILFKNGSVSGAGWSGLAINGASNITVEKSKFNNNGIDGITFSGAWSTIVIDGGETNGNGEDGVSFNDTGSVASVRNHLSASNGRSESNTSGDGYTAHASNSGLSFSFCIAHSNLNTAFAFVGTSSGHIINCVGYQNGGLTSFGGGPSARGGLYIFLTDTSGAGWTIKNYLGQGNYPYELFLDSNGYSDSTLANNAYYHIGNRVTEASFAYVDTGGGIDTKTWAQWVALSKESNGVYATKSIRDDFTLPAGHEAIDTGTPIWSHEDYPGDFDDDCTPGIDCHWHGTAPDIGAYEYECAACSEGDYEPDGDVDGTDLFYFISGNIDLDLLEFATSFGRVCL